MILLGTFSLRFIKCNTKYVSFSENLVKPYQLQLPTDRNAFFQNVQNERYHTSRLPTEALVSVVFHCYDRKGR